MIEKQMEQLLWEFSVELLFIVDGKGIIQKVNNYVIKELGFSEDELVGIDIRTLFQKNSQPIDLTGVQESAVDTEIYRKNRTCFPVEGRIGKSDDGTLYILALSSTLDQKVAKRDMQMGREAVEQANKVQHEFMANVTHELRTPVNGILGHVRNLLEEEALAPHKNTLHIIEGCCDNMNKIISNLLDFSKLESGKFQIEERKFSFRKMIEHVVDTNIAAVNEKGLKLSVSVAQNVPEYVIGDELRIMQVLNNLISNAMKFTPVGYIKVEVIQTMRKKHEVELFFIVMDSGIGISEEGKQKLFQSFSQVDASITRKYGGTGLGLAVCKELVTLMRGTIRVDSELDEGSTFSFSIWLRLADEEKDTNGILAIQEQFQYGDEADDEAFDTVKEFNSTENKKEIADTLDKLVLCVEMENWDRAEKFADYLKQLVKDAPDELDKKVFRMQMQIRKANYEKTMEMYHKFTQAYRTLIGGEDL